MKLQIVVILLGCITATIAQSCAWSGCEGALYNDQQICDYYGTGIFNRQTDRTGCSWDTYKRYCCKSTEACMWTRLCYGTAYGPATGCTQEFGNNYRATNNQRNCGGLSFSFECCK